jgi:cytoskeletal protein RodZ
MAPTQRRPQTSPKSNKPEPKQETNQTRGKEEAQKSQLSFILILLVGFVLLIGYTIWSSINTYSNTMVHDME